MLNKILRFLFYWPIRLTARCDPIPLEPLKQIKIDKRRPICYLTVSSSIGNLLTIERLTQRLGLPSPFSPLTINGVQVKRTGFLRRPSFFSTSPRKTDILPIFKNWLDAARNSADSLQIIPITVMWSRNPSFEGIALLGIGSPTPSWKKFLILTFAGRDNCTIVSEPLDILKLDARIHVDQNPKLLRRYLELSFLKRVRGVIGKAFPKREQLITHLLQRPAVLAAIRREAQATGKKEIQLKAQAYLIYDGMVADTRYPLLRMLNKFLSCLWKRIYHGQTIIGADRVRQLVQQGYEIIYIPCHRSHMDYILLSYVIFHEGLPLPQIASGDNLNFFPVGPFIRKCGSYFIRRKMKGDNFYITLFREYMCTLFERGYATEFFIEGGRSRTGRTLPPKTGMVAMTVQAQLRGIKRPIAFIPTYLGYEHVSEVRTYMRELDGEAKKQESASQLLGIFKRLRYYGRGYVTFGKPVIVPRFLSENVPSWRNDIDPEGECRPEWLFDTVNKMSRQIILNLNDSATINGINLCALAIISDPDHMMTMRSLRSCLRFFLKILKVDGRRIPDSSVDMLIRQALELNKFHVYDVGDGIKVVRPSRGQTLQLTYFHNNIVHLFALPALIASIIISNGHIQRHAIRIHARQIFYFLRHELFVPIGEDRLDALIEAYIECFIREEYVNELRGEIYLSGDNLTEFQILTRCIHLNLIRYLVAVTALKHTMDDRLTVSDFMQKCITYSRRLPDTVTANSPEFADPILFRIMCDTFIRHEYFRVNADGTIRLNPEKILKLARATEPLLSSRDVKTLNGSSSYDADINERLAQHEVDQREHYANKISLGTFND